MARSSMVMAPGPSLSRLDPAALPISSRSSQAGGAAVTGAGNNGPDDGLQCQGSAQCTTLNLESTFTRDPRPQLLSHNDVKKNHND